jgi:hypothetical protein|tara:strand:+ start:944 stop:1120 length:177 start_codon:yes stop_codon:yes gene_type:complete
VVVLEPLWAASGIFEDQVAAIAERDFLGLAIRALVEGFSGGAGFYVKGLFSSIVNHPE